jgi:hypothetical protein
VKLPSPKPKLPALLGENGELDLRRRLVDLESEVHGLQAKCESQKAWITELEKGGGLFGGRWKARCAELEAEVEALRLQLGVLKGRDKGEEKYLPAVSEVTAALAVVSQERDEVRKAFSVALRENAEIKEKIEDVEFQRDERDSMLRDEEAKRQTLEGRQKKMQRQIAQMRQQHMRAVDTEYAKEQDGRRRSESLLAKTRVLGALGNVTAQVELGGEFLDNVCTLCKASPACERTRLLSWPHGTLVPRHVQDALQLLVDECQDNGTDPFAALEAWASGTSAEVAIGGGAASPAESDAPSGGRDVDRRG